MFDQSQTAAEPEPASFSQGPFTRWGRACGRDVRVVRILLSTPSDVDLERDDLGMLVREINDTIQFLTPDREIRLELVHYETHASPDVGAPQEVIDRQIPIDFEIYLGIMWKRAGTRPAVIRAERFTSSIRRWNIETNTAGRRSCSSSATRPSRSGLGTRSGRSKSA